MNPMLGLSLLLAGLLAVMGLPQYNHSPNIHASMSQAHAGKGRRAAQELAKRNTDFGFKLFKTLASRNPSKNIFFSPLSISMAFSMLCLGAQDSTLSEIKQGFNFKELPDRDVHEGFHYLIQRLQKGSQDIKLDLGNMLFLDERLQPQEKFLTDVEKVYNAETIPTDFHNLEVTQKEINDYVSQKTHGKINNLVQNIDSGTVMLLINYLFFQVRWLHEFDPKLTQEEDFMLDDNKYVKVPMMFRGGLYKVGHDDKLSCTILEMPYHGNMTAVFILPDEDNLLNVEEALMANVMDRWKKIISKSVVDVYMPRFSITGTYNLKKVLSHMGITKIFEEHGELTGISPHRSLKVGEAFHKAKLKIDEKGTEGAAASGAQTLPMETPLEVKFNKTFLMMIDDDLTASTLFLGKIANPGGK
ncbi:PREDICTED: serpin A12 [Elephantulus edwardii]|uniref:serpin A12 n=1 Tax=Elephantulus edwardii TaxID=28737 RepID=UPI0003F06066|nr:PREDICTED: serpin A12 [Elephantulus edwardii]